MAQWAGHRLIDRPLGDAELLVEACAELVMDTAQKAQDLAAAGIGTVSGSWRLTLGLGCVKLISSMLCW